VAKNQIVDWLLVGTGDIVKKRVADALDRVDNSRIVGVVGGIDRAKALAQKYGAQAFSNLDDALSRSDANAAYIATPVYRHEPEAVKAIEAGKHTLIEKPLGLTGVDAQQIVNSAVASNVKVGCAYYRRCFARFNHLRQLLADDVLGRIVLIRMNYFGWFSPTPDDPKRWRVDKSKSGGGPLADMGSHMFDLLIGLFGMPKTVFAHCDTLVHDYEVEDSSAMVMTLENGAQVAATFGWNTKAWRHELEVVGSEGTVLWLPADTKKVVVTLGRDVEEIDFADVENVHEPLVEDFVEAIINNRDPIVPVAEAVKTNLLLDGIYQSAQRGELITLY
jgi:predicted dehydrogenase